MLALAALQVFYERLTFDAFIRVMELTLPMEPLYPSSKDLFFCVRALYHTLTHHQNILQDSATRQWHCGHFLMLFRAVNAPLYHHFYREQIPVVSWVPELLGSLFVGFILNREDLLLVWDAYLADVSTQNGFPLHPYVCLAILMELTEELIEMDADEIFYRLKHLPKMNIRMVLRKAIAIQQSCSGLVDDQCLCY